MADRDDAARIEVMIGVVGKELIGCLAGIRESAGIAAAGAIDPAIVDIPHRNAVAAQIVGDPVHQRAVSDRGFPAAAVDHHDHAMRAAAGRAPQVDFLIGVRPISDRGVRLWARTRDEIGPGEIGRRHGAYLIIPCSTGNLPGGATIGGVERADRLGRGSGPPPGRSWCAFSRNVARGHATAHRTAYGLPAQNRRLPRESDPRPRAKMKCANWPRTGSENHHACLPPVRLR